MWIASEVAPSSKKCHTVNAVFRCLRGNRYTRSSWWDVQMRMSKRVLAAVPMFMLLALASSAGTTAHIPSFAQPRIEASQGCVNQGKDSRLAGPVVCWAQRHLSWKSPHKPHFFRFGRPAHTTLGVAWPPYIVVNSPNKPGHWRMFRIGFRYDRNWQGYIFPTAAWKVVSTPLEY